MITKCCSLDKGEGKSTGHKVFCEGLAISKNFLSEVTEEGYVAPFPEGLKNRRGGIFVK